MEPEPVAEPTPAPARKQPVRAAAQKAADKNVGQVHASLGFPASMDSVLVAIWVLVTPGEGHTHVHPSRLSRKETLLSHLT